MVDIYKFDILLVSLDPSKGSEINKTRPCVVISPNEMNNLIILTCVQARTPKTDSKNFHLATVS
ncbi:MAG: type II toxin-antitoxin system PemK/MazF family toxin [Rickettsia endosymbiont of Labidopullus appendiculatus]|nr:type II toxin-antitoxin system PemK/MazF family toxin [Rickettsia endosymbiont of Labidopullus appendiculatus]